MLKIKGKYLIFKSNIARMKIHLLIDNKSKIKLINESFVYIKKISTFKLKKIY